MKNLKKEIERIAFDSSKGLEERFEEVLGLRKEYENEDKNQDLKIDVVCFSTLIEMLEKENATRSNIDDLMQLYTLLAETYEELNEHRPIKKIAYEVMEMVRIDLVPWDAMKETVSRIIDALNSTVYHHSSYDLTLLFLRKAFDAGELNETLKGRARHLLKLRILLEDPGRHEYRLDKELQAAIANLFTPDELVKIILNPQIGHLRQDPVEFTYRWEDIYYNVEKRLEERFANAPRHMGFCFRYWSAKAELLKNEYNIDWKSPSQMNPRVMFD